MRRILLCTLLAAQLISMSPAAQAVPVEDTVLKAMSDEITRSIQKLKLNSYAAPYFISYDSSEVDRFEVYSSLGAVTGRSRSRWRSLEPIVRVGDYSFDNSKFVGETSTSTTGSSGLTIDDNYDSFRRKIWLATDTDYKSAVELLEEKKAYFKRNNIDNKLDDFSKEEPIVSIAKARPLQVDEALWTERIKKVSAVFREFPFVQISIVNLKASVTNRCFSSSEGTRIVDDSEDWVICIAASTQAKDGERIKDMEVFAVHKISDLPTLEVLEASARRLAQRLKAVQEAPLLDDYDGPVLFEEQAAAEFMEQILCDNLASQPTTLSAGTSSSRSNPFAEKIGKKVLPRQLSVADDPFASDFNQQPLFGGYKFDVQGVRSKRVNIINKGILKSLCTDRTPTKFSDTSNGHSNGYGGSTSLVFITSDSKNTKQDLIERGKELAKDAELPYFLIARRMLDPSAASVLQMPDSPQTVSVANEASVTLPRPIILVKHWVETDKEEIVRGARFEPVTARVLKDIDMVGNDEQATLMGRGADNFTHLICPSFIVKSMEVNKDAGSREKTPVLENPLAELNSKQ